MLSKIASIKSLFSLKRINLLVFNLFIVILQYTNKTMGATKTDLFTQEQNEISSLLKAIAHPARIAILEYLIKVDVCICGDIVNELPLAQPTISQHLKELKTAGLIKGSIEGTAICYCVDKTTVARIQTYFSRISIQLENKDNKCC
jgi:ArsR family transcriptional regulator, arsenate/arsenite/antimonite-responsive transcriptional repressor